jgi:hypothetical protein
MVDLNALRSILLILIFADDIMLISDNANNAQEQLENPSTLGLGCLHALKILKLGQHQPGKPERALPFQILSR